MHTTINKEFVFIAGMPRSGSTVLANILDQNPKFGSDAVTSGLGGLLSMVKENWDKVESFKSWPDPDLKRRVLQGIFASYYGDNDCSTIIDKNRAWPSHIESLEFILGKKPKIIMCVRDMRAIMASWEKLWRKNKDIYPLNIPIDAQHTVESRVAHWGSSKDHTGKAYLTIQDALQRGYKDCMLFVDFDKLTMDPHQQLKRIYEFIAEEHFVHDFNNINQKILKQIQFHG
jgi:sulfotransferase